MAEYECAICEKDSYPVTCSRCTLDLERRASKLCADKGRAETLLKAISDEVVDLQGGPDWDGIPQVIKELRDGLRRAIGCVHEWDTGACPYCLLCGTSRPKGD
ncbi:hypothetical protein DRQ25_05290 [Candidatus Fermentibacteria bacterium]|nr:MAG: hypothetical protein DRQ25_05290 [Candidatus Fermentibacteria bacterium]